MQTLRISLPGINALESSPDPRDYSLLADEDNVLIKEHSRGSGSTSSTFTIEHNLGYFPHWYAYGQVSSGRYQIANGYNLFGEWRSVSFEDDLDIQQLVGGTQSLRYFIFYDDIPE